VPTQTVRDFRRTAKLNREGKQKLKETEQNDIKLDLMIHFKKIINIVPQNKFGQLYH